ncbi:MAG TPA: MerR family transcriptional regulator [Clostridiales bacterium]|nr:MerR family transcriptional regulator [Clostridiales bacterium]
MKEKYNIGEVSEIFQIPKSTLRYWGTENLIQMDRNQVNDYREYTLKQILDISDIVFYRSLNIPIAKLRKIFEVTLEEFDDILYDTQEDIDAQIKKLKEIKKGIMIRRSKIKEVKMLQADPYSRCRPDMDRMVEFDISHFRLGNPYDFAILIPLEGKPRIQYGTVVSGEGLKGETIWENRETGNRFLQCILRISVDDPEENNLKEHLGYIQKHGYRAKQIVGRYLITAMDGIRYDYYKIWIELLEADREMGTSYDK